MLAACCATFHRAESFAPFSREALEKESQSQGKDKSQGKDQGKAKRKGQSKGRDQEEQGPKIQKGQEAFPARDRLCDDRGPGEEAHNLFLLGLKIEAAKAGFISPAEAMASRQWTLRLPRKPQLR